MAMDGNFGESSNSSKEDRNVKVVTGVKKTGRKK